jgi:ABC-type transport system involved in cytochrome c biogenesis permease subunit
MVWLDFPTYALIIFALWLVSILAYSASVKFSSLKNIGSLAAFAGIVVLAYFIVLLWTKLDRPPLRTLGETRLWYSLLLPIVGLIVYFRWKYLWFVCFTLGMAILFLSFNYFKPEIHNKTLMPALQSVWFVPHVIVYIIGYVILGASSLAAVFGLFFFYFKKKEELKLLYLADNLVYIGFAFLTLGLLFGALWAKEAWGHYWTWDPKETWAFLTWMGYLVYMHYRYNKPKKFLAPLWTLSIAFFILLIAWFGVNYLPSAQNSVHVYSQ